MKLFKKSANQNLPSSQASLAEIYRIGLACGGPDYEQAYLWAVKADENNNPEGTLELGVLYQFGQGVGKNRKYLNNYIQSLWSRDLSLPILD